VGLGQYLARLVGNWQCQNTTKAVQVGTSTNWIKSGPEIYKPSAAIGRQSWFWGSLTGDSNDKDKFLVPTRISPDTNWVDVCFGYLRCLPSSQTERCGVGEETRILHPSTGHEYECGAQEVGTENDWQSCVSSPGGFYHILKKKDGSFWRWTP